MSKPQKSAAKTQPLVVFSITSDENSTRWSRVGTAKKNFDGSLTLTLEKFPSSGVLHVRERHPADE